MTKFLRRGVLAAGLAAPFLARHGFAQSDWPKGPVRWVVAFAAGGAADTVARTLSVRVSEIIGQQLIIENRTGGNAVVAANAVLQSPRDGQTFLIDAANQVTNPFLIKDLPFEYQKTWLPVTKLSDFPQVVAVKQDFPAKTIQEYIALAKAKPDTVSYGTPPAAGMGHLAGEELQRRAGIKLIHAPFRGGADAARDIGAGAIDSVIITTSSIRPPLAAGRARVLAVTSLKRAPIFPDVPTLAEVRLSRLRHDRLERTVRRHRHAARADRAHAGGVRRGDQGRQGEGATGCGGRRAGCRQARGFHGLAGRPAHPARQADRRRQHQAGLSGARKVSLKESTARNETAAAAMIMKAGL